MKRLALLGLLLLLASILAVAGCDDDPSDGDGDVDGDVDGDGDGDVDGDVDGDSDADADADIGPAPDCVALADRFALPTPAWDDGDMLTAPADDMAGHELSMRRDSWYQQLDRLDGWPARPSIIIPLWGTATEANGAMIQAHGAVAGSDEFTTLDTTFTATLLEEGGALFVRPDRPFPEDIRRVVVAVAEEAATGATVMPSCGPDGEPDPAYAEAAEVVPPGPNLALAIPFPLATAHNDLPGLYDRLSATPALTVGSVESQDFASLGELAPPAETAAHLADPIAVGILELPDYRTDDGWVRGDDGLPEAAGTTEPGFVVVLPATGEPPYPFVLFQHGGSQNKIDVLQLAGPLAAEGFAFVAIDLPYHGDRGGGGGTDMDILDFADPHFTRDNLRQASADHIAVLTGIAALNEAVESALGTADALDTTRAFYMGLSLGGITGSMTYSSAHHVMAAALFVAAADYTMIIPGGMFELFLPDLMSLTDVNNAVMYAFLETFLYGADPLGYATRVEDRSVDPRPLLLMQAVDDPIIPMPSSDYWGLVFGADLAVPFHHEVAGMEQLTLPASDNFAWGEEGGVTTRVLVQAPMNDHSTGERHGGLIVQPYSQEMVAHCFRSFLDTGSCEVIDTGYNDH